MEHKNDEFLNNVNTIDFQDEDILYKIEKLKVNRPIIGIVNNELPNIRTLELYLDDELNSRISKLEEKFEMLKQGLTNLELVKEIKID